MGIQPCSLVAAFIAVAVTSGCTSGGHLTGHVPPSTPSSRAVAVAVATCGQSDIGETGRPGKFVYLGAPNTTVHTQRGFEVVVHPAHGDRDGQRWRLAATGGASHVCRLHGNFVPSVIAAFIIRSPGTVTFEATSPAGTKRLTIQASG